jgi:FeS assembly SUF system protein
LPPAHPAPAAPPPAAAPTSTPAPADERPLLDRVIDTIKTCYDPEIPLNIYDLALIYGVDVDPEGKVLVKMTLTSPACPVAGSLPGEVQQKIAGIPGVKSAHVELVWDPPWDLSRLSEAARLSLGMS